MSSEASPAHQLTERPRGPGSRTSAATTRREHRGLLLSRPNPRPSLEYLVTHGEALSPESPAGTYRLILRYVPDRLVLRPGAFATYVDALARDAWPGPEDLGVAVLDDVSNELVPRWLGVRLSTASGDGDASERYEVSLEDRQPGWDNQTLLDTLAPR